MLFNDQLLHYKSLIVELCCYKFFFRIMPFLLQTALCHPRKHLKNMVSQYLAIAACLNVVLYDCTILLQLVFSFANFTEQLLLELKELVFTISTCLFATVFCSGSVS